MGPIRTSEMREGSPYIGEDFDLTDWGCLEQDETAPPHASSGRKSSRAIDHLAAHFYEERSHLMMANLVCCVPSRLVSTY